MPALPSLARSTLALGVIALGSACILPISVGQADGEASETETSATTGPTSAPAESTGPGVTGPVGTSSSTSQADTSEADTSDSTGMLFLIRSDGGIVEPECDVWAQDCPRGMKCMPWANDGGSAWNAVRCSELDPDPDAVGEPCTVVGSGVSGIDSCAQGSMCWDVDPKTLEGTCVAFCGGDEVNPTCDAGTACTSSNDGVLVICLPVCNPALPQCPAGQSCFQNGDDFLCLPTPAVDPGGLGESCEDIAVCDPGLACLQAQLVPDCTSAGCCSPYCDVTDPMPPCLPGQQCTPWYEPGMAPAGLESLGVCALPV